MKLFAALAIFATSANANKCPVGEYDIGEGTDKFPDVHWLDDQKNDLSLTLAQDGYIADITETDCADNQETCQLTLRRRGDFVTYIGVACASRAECKAGKERNDARCNNPLGAKYQENVCVQCRAGTEFFATSGMIASIDIPTHSGMADGDRIGWTEDLEAYERSLPLTGPPFTAFAVLEVDTTF